MSGASDHGEMAVAWFLTGFSSTLRKATLPIGVTVSKSPCSAKVPRSEMFA